MCAPTKTATLLKSAILALLSFASTGLLANNLITVDPDPNLHTVVVAGSQQNLGETVAPSSIIQSIFSYPFDNVLSYRITTGNNLFAINRINGAITLTAAPTDAQAGIYTLTIESTDGFEIATTTLDIVIEDYNRRPTFSLSTDAVILAPSFSGSTHVTVVNPDDGDTEAIQTLSYSINVSDTGFATLAIDSESGTITITRTAGQFGIRNITVTINDSSTDNNTFSQVFSLQVASTPVFAAPTYRQVKTYAGSGSAGYLDGAALSARFRSPADLEFLPDGRLLVLDNDNHRIRVISADGSTVSTYAGTGVAGSSTGSALTEAQFSFEAFGVVPTGGGGLAVATDGRTFVSLTLSNQIHVISADGSRVDYVTGDSAGFRDGAINNPNNPVLFNRPLGMDFSTDGRLVIADRQNRRVRIISADGSTVSTLFQSSDFQSGVAIHPQTGRVFTTASFRRLFSADIDTGSSALYAGQASDGYIDGPRLSAAFENGLFGIAFSSDGRLFVADAYNHRIRVISADGIVSTYAGSGEIYAVNASADSIDGLNRAASFASPNGLAVSTDGRLFVADREGDRIRVISENSTAQVTLVANQQYAGSSVFGGDVLLETFSNADESAVSYSIIGGNNAGLFTINPDSGAITLTNPPAEAQEGTYTLTVAASNAYGSAQTQMIVALEALDNHPPVFTLSQTTLTLTEGFSGTHTLSVVTPNDGDADGFTQTITYSLSPASVNFAAIAINPQTGEVTVNSIPNGFGEATIYVVATDSSATNNASRMPFVLAISPVNAPPTFTLSTTALTLAENFGSAQITITQADDGDSFVNQPLTYSISTTDVGFATLTINPQSGAITLGSFYNTFGSSATIVVTANDAEATDNIATQSFTLTVLPSNNPPLFTLSTYAITLDNDFILNTAVFVNNSDDGDFEATQTLSYSLSTTNVGFATISIDANSGAVTLRSTKGGTNSATIYVVADDGGDLNNRSTRSFTLNTLPINEPPTFTLSTTTLVLAEDFGSTQVLSLNVDDSEAHTTQALTFSISTTNIGFALLSISSQTGTITLSSVPNTPGAAQTVTVTVDDGGSVSNLATRTVSLHIIDTNNPPIFTLSTYVLTVDEDFSTNTAVFVNSSDDGDLTVTQTLSYSLAPTNTGFANLSIDSSGRITISSIADQFGEATIWVVADDSSETNNRSTQSFTLMVHAVNDAPTFALSTTALTMVEDFSTAVSVYIVNPHDSDIGTQTLSYSLSTTNTGFAALTIDPLSGTLTISSVPDGFGASVVTVTIDDGNTLNSTAIQTFLLVVRNVNDAPQFTLSTSVLTLNEDFDSVNIMLLNEDDGDVGVTQTLSYSLSTTNVGFATLLLDEQARQVGISNIPNQFGMATITITVDDSSDTNSQFTRTVALTVLSVNDRPSFRLSLNAISTLEDFTETIRVSILDVDDGDPEITQALTYSIDPTSTSIADLNFDAQAGTIDISSVDNAFGEITITVSVVESDSTDSYATQSFSLTVNTDNDRPSFTLSTSSLALDEDFGTVAITVTDSNDGDPGTTQTLTYSLSTTHVGFASLVIDAQSGTITLNSVDDQFGTASIMVTVDDGAGGDNPRFVQSVALSVASINDPPVFSLSTDTLVLDEDFEDIAVSVASSNDGDGTNQALIYTISTTHVGFATLSIDALGTINIESVPNGFGVATIAVGVDDSSDTNNRSTQSFILTVNALNDTPSFTLSTDTLVLAEDFEDIAVSVDSSNDGDPETTQTLSYSISTTNVGFASLTVNDNTGLIDIRSVLNAFGSAVITVTVNDGGDSRNIATRSFSLTAYSVNDTPTFALSTTTLSLPENFGAITVTVANSDDGDQGEQTLLYSLSSTDTGFATLSIDENSGEITVITVLNAFGDSVITVTVNDGGDSNNIATQSLSVTVFDANNPPSFTLSTYTLVLDEDFGVNSSVTITSSSDGDITVTQTLSYSLSPLNTGFATLDIDAQSGAVTINSVENAFGSTQITVTVNDSSASNNIATQSFSLVVTSVNDAPIFELSTTLLSFNENVPPLIRLFVRNASNGDDSTQSLTYSISTSDVGFASIAIDPSLGTISINPVPNRVGGAVIYVVADDGGDTNNRSTQSFTLLIGPPNNAPSFTLSSNNIVVDEDFGNAQITVTDSDDGDVAEEQTLSYSISQADVGFATLAIDVSGTITITSIADANGEAVITVTVDDGAVFNNISTQSISLTVRAVNDRPMFTLSTSTLILEENFDPVQVSIASVDDGDGDVTQTLSYSVSQTDVGFATLAIDAQSGEVTINSVQNRVGLATIYVSVDDGALVNNTATQSFTISVNAVQSIAGLRPTTASDYAGTIAGTANGAALSQAQFNAPSHLALMADNRLLVVDTDNHRIQVVSADGNTVLSTYAGGLEGYADGPAASAAFNAPRGIAVALDGRVFVADTNNHRIRVISSDGNTVSTYAGSGAVGGTNGFANGSSATARFDLPHGLAIATDGRLFVADTANNRIQVISADGNTVSTYAGDGGTGLINGDAASARFTAPEDVAIAPDGRLFVADTQSHLIRVISADGATVSTYAGNGGVSRVDGAADSAQFNAPRALFAAGSTVFVADTHNDAIRVISADGSTVSTFFTHSDVLGLSAPNGVVVSTDGRRVFATNSDNQRVVRLLIDNSQPVLTVSSSSLSLQEGFDPITVSVIATDGEDGLIDWSVSDGENVVAVTQAARAITLSDINQTGNVTLTVSAMDSLGATAYERIIISVTEAPTTTPPATNGGGSGGGGGGCSLHHTATTDWVLWLLVLLSVVALRRRRYS